MTKNIDNPEKKDDDKHFAWDRGVPHKFLLSLQIFYNIESKLINDFLLSSYLVLVLS